MPDLKDEIVNKSFFQFLNRGYKACSLKDLEKATGLTKGAFYYYFRNKEEILKAGIEKYLSVVSEISEEEFLEVGSLKAYIDIVVARKERRAEQLQQMFFFIGEMIIKSTAGNFRSPFYITQPHSLKPFFQEEQKSGFYDLPTGIIHFFINK